MSVVFIRSDGGIRIKLIRFLCKEFFVSVLVSSWQKLSSAERGEPPHRVRRSSGGRQLRQDMSSRARRRPLLLPSGLRSPHAGTPEAISAPAGSSARQVIRQVAVRLGSGMPLAAARKASLDRNLADDQISAILSTGRFQISGSSVQTGESNINYLNNNNISY